MKEYDPTKWYLSKNDKVWYINYKGDIVRAKVIERDTLGGLYDENDPNLIKRYWIEPANVFWWHKIWDNIRLWAWLYLTKGRKPYMPNWRFPGHSVELGAEIFLTYNEALDVLHAEGF